MGVSWSFGDRGGDGVGVVEVGRAEGEGKGRWGVAIREEEFHCVGE